MADRSAARKREPLIPIRVGQVWEDLDLRSYYDLGQKPRQVEVTAILPGHRVEVRNLHNGRRTKLGMSTLQRTNGRRGWKLASEETS